MAEEGMGGSSRTWESAVPSLPRSVLVFLPSAGTGVPCLPSPVQQFTLTNALVS